jgi:hypothetical protein
MNLAHDASETGNDKRTRIDEAFPRGRLPRSLPMI